MKKKQALLIVDHGSVKTEANDLLDQVAQMMRYMSTFEIVHYAHMELAEPSIQAGFDACVADGAEEVIVHPYFLSPGRHSKEDIPRLVAAARQRHPQISYRVTEPLGLDRVIGDLILKRVQESGNKSK
jgi:sirohydrochlorin ferrochelatase